MSRKRNDGKHEILGFGWNHLREGIPGIHGETGAIISMGRLKGGYREVVATSSLSPCPFCQCCLALHLGIKQIRILDATNYKPDYSGYEKVGINPTVREHPKIVKTFRRWVRDPKNALIWSRDIGLFKGNVARPFDVKRNPQRTKQLMALAHLKAAEGLQAGEAPIGAVIVDQFGEVIGADHPRIVTNNDPSMVAAMSAWRACGAREHWKNKTLFLTCGPDHIAYSMFHVFNFGQLVVGSDRVFTGRLRDVRRLGVGVHVLGEMDAVLKRWRNSTPKSEVRQYLGLLIQRPGRPVYTSDQ
jgi:tRNA(Arg) A34 adenosine deaminase TadA